MSIISDLGAIKIYRFATLVQALRLEIAGMRRSKGPSAYATLKAERGYKGNKAKVYDLARADHEREKAAFLASA